MLPGIKKIEDLLIKTEWNRITGVESNGIVNADIEGLLTNSLRASVCSLSTQVSSVSVLNLRGKQSHFELDDGLLLLSGQPWYIRLSVSGRGIESLLGQIRYE